MVVVDYSSHDRIRRNNYNQNDDTSQQLDHDAIVDIGIANFCPRLRQAISALSRHTVGPLQQRVQLSDFQSSTLSSLPTEDLSSNAQLPRNDKFVLALPYLYEDNLPLSRHNFMVRWLIIAQCGHPDKAPEVILLETDYSSVNSGYGETSSRRTLQRPQQLQRRQYQTNQIIQERYWQQYVASDAFYIQCLTKWDKIINNSSFILQYCLLADQLYECYVNFQLYKLKISLKSTPTMLHPPPHLVQAYTQYKQLTKLSKLNMAEVGNVTNDISVELFIDLDNGNNYDDRRNQITWSATVRMRSIISLVSSKQTASTTTEATDCADNTKIFSQLASVTGIFPPTANKNATKPGDAKVPLNEKFVVRILSSKLCRTTPQGGMMAIMLNAITGRCFDTAMIDYVTYVRRVQQAAVQAYNYDPSNSQEDKQTSDADDNNSIKLLLEALHEVFCDYPSNGNCLLDYQINNNETSSKDTTSYFRFLLIDDEMVTENTQLKYILTIEYNKEISEKLQTSADLENTNQSMVTKSVPVVALRSVYDDENVDNYLNIDIDDLIKTDNLVKYYSELANIIKITTKNGMRKLRKDVLTPVLTRYNKQWAPTDPYFVASSSTPPPYPAML